MKHRLFTRLGILGILLSVGLSPTPILANILCNNPLESSPGQLSPSDDCIATINEFFVLDDGTSCDGPFFFVIRDNAGNILASGLNSVDVDLGNYLNTIVEIEVTDTDENLTCNSYYLVEDKQPPVLTCPMDIVECTASLAPANIAPISVVDNCDGAFVPTYVDVKVGPDCAFPSPFIGQIFRNYSVVDDSGNPATCVQEIFILRADTMDVDFPENDTLNCNASADTSITGRPTIDGRPINFNGCCNIAVAFEDLDTLDVCGESMLILREWTIGNECTGQIAVDTQRIFLRDTMPPVMTCPASLAFETDLGVCTATFNLPLPSVTENCGSFEVTASIAGYGAGFSYSNVPKGPHTVSYMATDACGNFSICETPLVISDNESPTAVCDEIKVVALPSNGQVVLNAASFNDGSNDNCSPLTYLVSRDGVNFGPTVSFNCNDVDPANPIMVTLKVTQTQLPNLMNFCMTEMEIQDKLPPILDCPDDLTIDCEENMDDLEMFGMPTIFDNCGVDLQADETMNINGCGFGTITRVFTVTDPSGNVSTCTQTITVINETPFNGAGIVFPPDYTVVNGCVNIADLEPGDLPVGYNGPVLPTVECAMLATSFTDQVFDFDYPACYKIVRTWKVIDWCNPASPIWQDQQVIAVMDTEPPVVTFCPPPASYGLSANCGPAIVNLSAVTAIATCTGESLTITNNSPYATSGGANASGIYPEGVHHIKFTITDGCGNTATCSTTVTVTDLKDPTPYCSSGTVGELQAMPNMPIMVALNAWQLNFASYDNCTAASDLVFTIRELGNVLQPPVPTLIFDCADTGSHEIELWVTDEAGNTDYCITEFIVQDNMDLCNDDPAVAFSLTGSVVTTMGEDLPEVHVEITAMGMETMTDNLGSYAFSDLQAGNTYFVEPWKNDDPLNGITTFDLVLMTKHVLNIQPITDPYKLIAGDVNKSGKVTTADILELRKMVLHINDEFPNNDSWRFVRADYPFPDPTDPFTPPFPEVVYVPNIDENVFGANFIAVKTGDLNGSAAANFGSGADDRSQGEMAFFVEDKEIQAGEEFTVPFSIEKENDLIALQFTIEFETDLELQGIEKGEVPGVTGDRFDTAFPPKAENTVTGAWYHTSPVMVDPDDVLFSLRFRSGSTGRLSEMLHLSSRFTRALVHRGDGMEQDLTLNFKNTADMQTTPGFQLFQNQPNPFKKVTNIGFMLPEAGPARLSVYDISGAILRTWEQEFDKGFNQVTIQRNDLPQGGVLYYQLETQKHTATKKMILLQ